MPKQEIEFTVYGEPVAQGRARSRQVKTKTGKEFTTHYDPTKSRNYKGLVHDQAIPVRPDIPLEGMIILSVKAYKSIPKSFSKVKHNLAVIGELRPLSKPDLKNIIAGIEDALTGLIWRDDSQVVSFDGSGKWYSDVPRVEVTIREM